MLTLPDAQRGEIVTDDQSSLEREVEAGFDRLSSALHNALDAAFDVGERLLILRQFIPHGQWQTYVETRFQQSYRTCMRLMAVAKSLAPYREQILAVATDDGVDALYRLADKKYDGARDALAMLEAGDDMVGAVALRHLEQTAPDVASLVKRGRITVSEGEKMAEILPELPTEVGEVIVGHAVTNSRVQQALAGIYDQQPELFGEWADSGALYIAARDETIPLHEAGPTDVAMAAGEYASYKLLEWMGDVHEMARDELVRQRSEHIGNAWGYREAILAEMRGLLNGDRDTLWYVTVYKMPRRGEEDA